MHGSTLVLIILAAGLASQWLAWRVRLPAIIVLIAVGLLLGPISGVIDIALPRAELTELLGLGVAIILFEGGMDLKLGEFRRAGKGIGRLTLLVPPLAWLFGSLAAHYVAGLSWPVSWVLGAILVVTGPTVILPLLRQARLDKQSASLLKWEGIVNDPVGVLLAVLTFQYFTVADSGVANTLLALGAAVAAAAVLGGLGGWLTGWFFRRGAAPEYLKAPALMVLALVVYWTSNLIQPEAGLLSVTLMGMVVGNMRLVERDFLRDFEENLTVLLLAVLFIVIPSQLEVGDLELIDWRVFGFVLAILFLVRPLAIALATVGEPMRRQDKILLAWIAPRGIVAAATAGIFGPEMVAQGYPDAGKLLPIVFLIILTTVLMHGLTIGPLARRLGIASARTNGLLIVGASQWSDELALTLKKLGVDVLVADGSYPRLKQARMAGVEVYFGEILSEHAEHALEAQHLSHLLCATDNDYYNALVCKAQGSTFGHHRTFQLATHQESSHEPKRLPMQQRGHIAFDCGADFDTLHERLTQGWRIQTAKLSGNQDFDQLKSRVGELGRDWLLLAAITPNEAFRLYSPEQPFKPDTGWTLIYFGPSPVRDAPPEVTAPQAA